MKSYRRGAEYTLYHAKMARKMALLGLNDTQMADVFGVSLDRFSNWIEEYPELEASLFTGRALASAEVANSLFKRATGYSHPAVKFFKMGKPGEEHIHTEVYTEHYPPDTAAGTFWLKNKHPELWRDQSHQAMTDAEGNTVTPPILVIQTVKSDS